MAECGEAAFSASCAYVQRHSILANSPSDLSPVSVQPLVELFTHGMCSVRQKQAAF